MTVETKRVVQKLNLRIDDFAEIEHMQYIKDTLLPRLKDFSEMITTLLSDNNEVKVSVRAFDKSICNKATKTDMKCLREDLMKNFIHIDNWKGVQDEVCLMHQRLEEHKLSI